MQYAVGLVQQVSINIVDLRLGRLVHMNQMKAFDVKEYNAIYAVDSVQKV